MKFKTTSLIITVRPDDIVEILTKEGWSKPDNLEIAAENITAMKNAVNGQPRGILSKTPNTYISKEVMKYYSEAEVGEVATVILVDSFGSKILGNIFLKLTGKSRGDAPVRIFSDRDEGIKWLLECIAKAKREAL